MFNFIKNKKKLIPLFGIIFLLFFSCKKDPVTPEDCTPIIPPPPIDTCAILSFKMDDALCALDSVSNTFYFSIDKYEMNFSPKIEIENEPTEILINGNIISNYAINDLGLVKVNEPIDVKLFYCDSIEKEYQLIFTRFPILQITANQSILDNPKVAAEFRLNDPDFLENGMTQREFISVMGIELRGGSAQNFPKKSYAIELWEEDLGINSVDTSFFGLRNDDDWILDAMYSDIAKMRNRVSMDLWLDFNELPYHDSEPNAKGATRGKFIEVFLGQEYMGVYVFSERIDRKQLKLKSFEDGDDFGLLYKASRWENGTVLFNNYFDFDPISDYWEGWEHKYPDPFDEEIIWEPLANFTQFVIESSDNDFKNQIEQKLEIDNAIDYLILLNLTRGDDNTGKNVYFSKYKQSEKFFMLPWDLDATWGRFWNAAATSPNGFLSNGLFDRLIETDANDFKNKLKTRWSTSRNNIFTKNNLMSRFQNYGEEMDISDVFQRDRSKWNLSNSLAEEMDHINTWLDARLIFLDDYFENL